MAVNDAQGDAVMAEAAAQDAEIVNNSSSSSASNGGLFSSALTTMITCVYVFCDMAGRCPFVIDLQNAMPGASAHRRSNGSHLVDGEGNGRRIPAYNGIVRSESISFKVASYSYHTLLTKMRWEIDHPCPQNATEMEQLSRDIGKEVEKMYCRRMKHSRKLVLAKTATVPGCILNITEIFAPHSVPLDSVGPVTSRHDHSCEDVPAYV